MSKAKNEGGMGLDPITPDIIGNIYIDYIENNISTTVVD